MSDTLLIDILKLIFVSALVGFIYLIICGMVSMTIEVYKEIIKIKNKESE